MADREKVIDGLCGAIGLIHGYIPKSLWVDGYEEQACRDAIALLKEQDTQKHGYWIRPDDQMDEDVKCSDFIYCICSNCNRADIHAKGQEVPYCWWCGAKMDEEVKQNETD